MDTKCWAPESKVIYKLDLSITDALVTWCGHIVLNMSELLQKHQCFIHSSSIGVLKIKILYGWFKLWRKRKMFAKLLIHSSSTAVLKIEIKYLESRCIIHKQWLKKAVQKNITEHCILSLEWSQDKKIKKNTIGSYICCSFRLWKNIFRCSIAV